MTYYRHNEDAYDLHPGLPDVFRSLVRTGVLEPAEPDYEAAYDTFMGRDDTDWYACMVAAVDAAYGIGGGDAEQR